jgi:hypothetical protein
MSLTITRRSGESIFLHLHPDADDEALLQQLATIGIDIRMGKSQAHKQKFTLTHPNLSP